MPFSGLYPCIDKPVPIRIALQQERRRWSHPSTGTRVFIEVQVREKRVYRTRSGLLLNHLQVSSPSQAPSKYLSSWRLFQIDYDDLLAEDVFSHCCDAKSLLSMYISTNKHTAARFLNFFKRRVSLFCRKIAANLLETKPEVVIILTHITTVCVIDLDNDFEGEHALKSCGKSCIPRRENPYGATCLRERAFLFSPAHGSLTLQDSVHFHGQTCSILFEYITTAQ